MNTTAAHTMTAQEHVEFWGPFSYAPRLADYHGVGFLAGHLDGRVYIEGQGWSAEVRRATRYATAGQAATVRGASIVVTL